LLLLPLLQADLVDRNILVMLLALGLPGYTELVFGYLVSPLSELAGSILMALLVFSLIIAELVDCKIV
jgi:hypothetical protein